MSVEEKMMMDEETEDFIEEEECCCSSEISSEVDSDYEFDASRIFDFTRPETSSEAEEAEDWFRCAPDYPHSPFAMRLNLEKIRSAEACCSSSLQDKDIYSTISNSGALPESHMNQQNGKARAKSAAKPAKARSSTLMKPTASLLAKQNKLQDLYSGHLCQRHCKSSTKPSEAGTRSPSVSEDLATKRQKLETGFLWKVAHLKHQALLSHKKVTIPKEPQLETMQRAEQRRSKKNSESSEHAKQKDQNFKARPLNRKMTSPDGTNLLHQVLVVHMMYYRILEGPNALPSRKSTPKFSDFQLLDKHSDVSIVQRGGTNLRSSHSKDILEKEKRETSSKMNSRPLNRKNISNKESRGLDQNIRQEGTISKESRTSSGERLLHNLPIESFKKLSIKSGTETNLAPQTKVHRYAKGAKENAPDAFQLEFRRCMGKPNQCDSSNGIRDIGSHPNMNRSLDIR